MKPIIIEMKDMTDSTEVYAAKPHPIFAGFIYLILSMVIIAFIWMYTSRMDIVVKGTGTITVAEDVATITNQVAGTISARNIQDGQEVKAGEVLYVVATENESFQLVAMQQQYADCMEQEEMLEAYVDWLKHGETFSSDLLSNTYYNEIAARKLLLEIGEQSEKQTYSGEMSAYDTKISTNAEILTYYEEAIEKSGQLVQAVRDKNNPFSSEDSYYRNMIENYLSQRDQIANQYNDKIYELQKQSEEAGKEIEILEARKVMLQEQAVLIVVNESAVSGGDAVTQPNNPQQELQTLEQQIKAYKDIQAAAENGINQYNAQIVNALNVHEKETIAAIEGNIMNYEQTMTTYKGVQQEYTNGKNTLAIQGTEMQIENLVTQELHTIFAELESCRQSKTQLSAQIEGLEQIIDNATVIATMDGRVNLLSHLVEGDYIAAGTQVLTIIPDAEESAYIVTSYVENKDIAKIHEGMEVTYEIAAYPSREYGTMRGEVTFVSADLKVNNNGSAYYEVRTSIDAGTLCNQVGEVANLKVGMLCETKIVVEEKSVLEVLVEKVFHFTN